MKRHSGCSSGKVVFQHRAGASEFLEEPRENPALSLFSLNRVNAQTNEHVEEELTGAYGSGSQFLNVELKQFA